MILHHPQWSYAKKLLKSGAIGNLVQVDGVFSYNNSANDSNNIRNHSISGGGSLLRHWCLYIWFNTIYDR